MPPRKARKDKEEPRTRTRTTSTPNRITRVRIIGEPGAVVTGSRGRQGTSTSRTEVVSTRKAERTTPVATKSEKARRAKRTKRQKEEDKENLRQETADQKKRQRIIARRKKAKRTRRST